MDIQNIEKLVDEHLSLIVVDGRGMAEARERSAKFLVLQSVLINFLKELEQDIARVSTMNEVCYSKALIEADGKTVTEKKAHMVNNQEYANAKYANAEMDSIKNWIKGQIKIFENAHLLFRQFSRE